MVFRAPTKTSSSHPNAKLVVLELHAVLVEEALFPGLLRACAHSLQCPQLMKKSLNGDQSSICGPNVIVLRVLERASKIGNSP